MASRNPATAGSDMDRNEQRTALLRLLRDARAAGPKAPEGIAVIGLAGRYPRSATPEELWTRVRDGENCVTEFTPGHGRGEPGRGVRGAGGRQVERGGGAGGPGSSTDADAFDPLFFGIAPVDAENMDPQERVFLETVWATLEDAGYPPRRLAHQDNPVGVFVGVMNSDVPVDGRPRGGPRRGQRRPLQPLVDRQPGLLRTGPDRPSLTVNTACAASLTAVHLACESLRAGECTVAVAGGVNLILHTSHLRTLADNGMTSPRTPSAASARAPTASSTAREPAPSCSSRSRGRWPTATGSTG